MAVIIRAGRAEDWEPMREIFIRAGQAAWGHILSPAALADMSAPDRWDPCTSADVLVADLAGKPVGFVCTCASANDDADATVGEVDAFYVDPSLWGQGVGRALLAAAVERLIACGFESVTLWTEHRNVRALRFYRAAGWKLDGRERRRIYRGSELLELRHRLALIAAAGYSQ